MKLSKDDEVWVFDGNLLYMGIIVEERDGGHRFCYTSGLRAGTIAWHCDDYLFKYPGEKSRLVEAIHIQEHYLASMECVIEKEGRVK